MRKNKILSSVLAGILLGVTSTSAVKAIDNTITPNVICNVDESVNNLNLEGYETIDVFGTKFDLSTVNPAVTQSLIRVFDEINLGNLSIVEKNKKLEEAKNLLTDYNNNPSNFENFPITLDLGPSSQLREEISRVQSMIEDLKKQQEAIKLSKMVQKAIDEKVEELQGKIDYLSKWINYAVFNFNSSNYKVTFCEEKEEVNEDTDDTTNDVVNYEGQLIDVVYVTTDYNKVFRININGDGSLNYKGDNVSLVQLSDAIMKSLEFENIKVRDILEEIEIVKLTKVSKEEQEKRIKELEKKINDVKFYGISHEIALLNLKKESIKKSRLPQKEIDRRVEGFNEEIDDRIKELSKFKLNADYYVKSSLGEKPSYFGYVFDDNNGFIVKTLLDSDNKVEFKDMDNLSTERKTKLKNVIEKEIKDTNSRINEVVKLKMELEKTEKDNKYYLIDSMDKELRILNNNIKNFENILTQI